MDNQDFVTISNIIKSRRTVKAAAMNGNKIPNGHVAALLELADWAPNHGSTEPWRFVVYENPADFCQQHAGLYKEHTPAENFNETSYNNFMTQGNKASHVLVAVMKRGDLPKIPVFEEIIAASCAVENLLLGATALNIVGFWSTGGMILKQPMKDFLQLGEEDHVLGVLYLGYADEKPEGRRKIPLEEKVKWVAAAANN
ncbi:nitroreductase [Mucilaginibacter sp. RS28]|uniref:Nitroreductase n=1 Tax=Mucilaginibacter straminoryzae TaxID=2932774 RepID=A0A9X1X3Q5_9SPHI|nr:nitroreductase [Mucilaginibacter straminoryzae]MCJ8209068.1 nitroreductase [Mucilaginibacter straminoryzae]